MTGPAVLHAPDPRWPVLAAQLVAAVEAALAPLGARAVVDHIGSTAVPGLAAKPFLDLQVRLPELPAAGVLEAALAPVGFAPAPGSRPDSPGVHRDVPRGSEVVTDGVWRKRLFVRDADLHPNPHPDAGPHPDPHPDADAVPLGSILHVRLAASPWGRCTVWFRDWLRAHPDARDRYEGFKRAAAAEHAGDPDHDDYTRAKTAFFDDVQAEFEAWARSRTP